MSNQELVALPENGFSLEAFTEKGGLDPWLEQIAARVEEFEGDASTEKGRKAILSFAYKITRSKTALDAEGKKLVDRYKEIPRKIDAERRRMRETLDAMVADVQMPVTIWRANEEARVERLEEGLQEILEMADTSNCGSEEIAERIKRLEQVTVGEEWQEFQHQANLAKSSTMSRLIEAHQQTVEWEKTQEELARLRAEEARRLEQEKRQREEEQAEELALQRVKMAELRAAEEKQRQEKEWLRKEKEAMEEECRKKDEEEAAQRKRQKDMEWRAEVERNAAESLVQIGCTDEMAKLIIAAIAGDYVKHVKICY